MEAMPRWDPPATLYGSSMPNAPRVAPMGPSFPVPIATAEGKDKGKEAESETKLPNKPPRSIVGTERIAPLISQQGSRIPALALQVLPVSRTPPRYSRLLAMQNLTLFVFVQGPVYSRTTKVQHPPVLLRGTQKLTYGPGVNAPWNSGGATPPAATPQLPNGVKTPKDKEKEKAASTPKPLPDARLYATWAWEQKSYKEPLAHTNRRTRMNSIQLSGVVGNGRRSRSESHG